MGLTNNGKVFIAQAIINDTPIFFNNTNARIGVGDSTIAFDATQTDLVGANKLRKGMDAEYPTRNDNKIIFKATFGSEDANFAWNEWGVFNSASGGVMINRKVENLGVKSGGNWVLTVELEIRDVG